MMLYYNKKESLNNTKHFALKKYSILLCCGCVVLLLDRVPFNLFKDNWLRFKLSSL